MEIEFFFKVEENEKKIIEAKKSYRIAWNVQVRQKNFFDHMWKNLKNFHAHPLV
jgi:hypothetical protein